MSQKELLQENYRQVMMHRNVCAIAFVFIGYSAWDETQKANPPWWFYLCMSIILLAFVATGLMQHFQAKKIEEEIANLNNTESETDN
ncbi:MAG: hypothetical protein ACRC5H_07290 [Treponemataceae bacterium]